MRLQVQQGRRGGERDVRAVREAEEAEGAGLGRFQLAVAEFEGGLHREVARLELVEAAALVGQLAGEDGDRPGAAGGQPGGGDADGEGEETAGGHHVQGRFPFRADPFRADDPREELERLVRRHHVQVHQVCPGQVDHPHPARHQGRAPRRPGQQRADLGRVVGVVEEDEDAAAVQRGAVERGPLVQGVRDRRVRGAERPQERAEDRLRLGRPRARALEVDVELPVGEVRAGLVGDVNGQGRLADPADPGQRGDRHHRPLGGGQLGAQIPYEGVASREVGHGRRKLRGLHGRRRRGRLVRRAGQLLVGPQDALLELGQFGARVDAQLLGEEPTGVRVHGQRLRLPPAAVQRHHQQLAQAFAQRVGGGERGQLGDGLRMAAHLQVQIEPGLGELEAPLLQPGALVLRVRPGHGGQRLAVPQAQHLVDQRAGLAAVTARAGLLRLGGKILRQGQVECAPADPERVPAGLADQRLLAQDLAEP
ncbi:hypothetical protein SCYAM73S_07121 [Streptomyces cyaneofuscatus]